MQYPQGFIALLLDTYQIAQRADTADFKYQLLERLKQLVPLDTAFWMTRSEVDTPYQAEETYTYNLPSDVQDNYIRYPTVYQQALELVKVLMDNMGTTIDVKSIMPQEQWLNSDMYLLHCKKYDIEHSVMTLYPSDHNQMIASISLNRHAHHQPFSESERLLIQNFVPHMVEAERINTIRKMKGADNGRALRAVVDKHGHIIEASKRFKTAIKQIGLHPEQGVTPELLARHLPKDSHLSLAVSNQAGLIHLELNQPPLAELISDKKLQLAHLLALGFPNKTIATKLHLAVDTVNDYVKDLYQFLAVSSRHEAVGQLLAMNVLGDEAGVNKRYTGAQLLYLNDGQLLYCDESLQQQEALLSSNIETLLQSSSQYHYLQGLMINLDKRKDFLLMTVTDMSDYAQQLTARESQVAFLVGLFFSNNAIAEALGISVKTVENQLTRIYQKLQLRNRSELVAQLNRPSQLTASYCFE